MCNLLSFYTKLRRCFTIKYQGSKRSLTFCDVACWQVLMIGGDGWLWSHSESEDDPGEDAEGGGGGNKGLNAVNPEVEGTGEDCDE